MVEEVQLKNEAGFRRFMPLPERKSLGQYAYENLKQAILNGELAPGERIVESRLANALSISRTPVREAIHKLEREGRLFQNPAGGFFVAGLSRKDIEETFGIRSVLESYAARLAAKNHVKRELEQLERKIQEFQICMMRKDMDDLPRINTELHNLLYAMSRSPRLIKMINELKDHIFRFRQVILKKEKMARTSNQDHRLMLELIKKRDADGVEKLVREHILRGQEVVLNEFDMQTTE